MDIDKLKQWMDIAQNMHGGDFWKNVFDQDFAKQFINDQSFNSTTSGFTNQSGVNDPALQNEKSRQNFPLIDLMEGDTEVLVLIELPGVPKEKIELGLNGNILSIKGIAMPLTNNLKPTYSERFYGEFQRQIKLPDIISPNELSAKFWNGVLFVSYKRFIEKTEIIPID
ncbi:MAG TPA: Hsp20/alpha crystallin family protein [Bacillales bacterium]|nr:Hsp20/alpha crystallin family protein [Bacillales bacterium]